MVTKIIRVAQGKQSTLSHLYIDGLFACYLLEDSIRAIKIPGQTCIPTGNFKLTLNTTSGMHAKYLKEYPLVHKGMVEIDELPNFDLVFIHKGNTHLDTRGCPLTGLYWTNIGGDYQVMMSTVAYQLVYPKLIEQIKLGNNRIDIENRIVGP
jgi:hypothetical protein